MLPKLFPIKVLLGLNVFFILFLSTFSINGQDLLNSRKSSPFTYVYKLKEAEAREVYTNTSTEIDQSFLHTLVDSFPTENPKSLELEKGHYIKTYARQDIQFFDIASVLDFHIEVFGNETDLMIKVLDLEGNSIKQVTVTVDGKKLKYDAKTKTFTDKKSNKKGLLEVSYNNITSFTQLNRTYKNSAFKRFYQPIIYRTPIKYIWLPIDYVIHLPIDGVKSISNGYLIGSIYNTKQFFVDLYEKTVCLFDPDYCNGGWQDHAKGYLVLNKPKFKPNNTIKLKAFLTNEKGNPINKKVKVAIKKGYNNYKYISTIRPYQKGAYEYEFEIADSLKLQLDRNYQLVLLSDDKQEDIYKSTAFRYEEYELKSINLILRTAQKNHYKKDSILFYVSGKDENDLNIYDGKLDIVVLSKSPKATFDDHVFVPDTLMSFSKELKKTGETKINISDKEFPKANFDYTVNVTLRTSDNEKLEKKKQFSYFYSLKEILIEEQQDSLSFTYAENGSEIPKEIDIYKVDHFQNEILIETSETPYRLKLDPYAFKYIAKTEHLNTEKKISDLNSNFNCFTERTADSISIQIQNPREIPFSYHIYKVNQLIDKGYGTTLEFKQKESSKANYFISASFIWAGKVENKMYSVDVNDRILNLNVEQPNIIFPGQETEIEVSVTDYKGEPVENVDLTAYGLTQKFKYTAPQVPTFAKQRKQKKVINSFRKEDLNTHFKAPINYTKWQSNHSLDSIAYYQFTFPQDSIYRFEYETSDSKTQFAPFVVKDGKFKNIYIIYVDETPIYFSWATVKSPYSFSIKPGKHQIKLRTSEREITLDSVDFKKGKKLILSLDESIRGENIKNKPKGDQLDYKEKRLASLYNFRFRDNFGGKYTHITSNGQTYLLNSRKNGPNIAGPVKALVQLEQIDGISHSFFHESGFEYEFSGKKIKMRSIDKPHFPNKLYEFDHTPESLYDEILYKEKIEAQWQAYLDALKKSKSKYSNPNYTQKGKAKIAFEIYSPTKDTFKKEPTNIVLLRNDTPYFTKIYRGKDRVLHNLNEGLYKMIFFYPNQEYHIEDSIFVKEKGQTILKVYQPQQLEKDEFSKEVSDIIERHLFTNEDFYVKEEKVFKELRQSYFENFEYTGSGYLVSGVVRDSQGVLPGVSVIVKGTNFGTVTNIEGEFTINVPKDYNTLQISYIGFETREIFIDSDFFDISLSENFEQLEEVVVIGYGSSTRKSLTGAVAGVSINRRKGSNIRIRGLSSINTNNQPLVVIDGKVYAGNINNFPQSSIKEMMVLKDTEAIAIYGSRASNGVIIISTKGPIQLQATNENNTELESDFPDLSSQSNSLRQNFSDEAFWEPKLITNKEGKAKFKVKFPDDVTKWNTFFLAANTKKQTGQTQSSIKSYKPLLAQTSIPKFLVEGDTLEAIGKVKNYLPDTMRVSKKFYVNEHLVNDEVELCAKSSIEKLPVIAKGDSLSIKYEIYQDDLEYYDGEKKKIPVLPLGLEETEGEFFVLNKDTTLDLSFDERLGEVNIYAQSDLIDLVQEEIKHVVSYRYLCNEQLSSKLKMLVSQKRIDEAIGKKFSQDKAIKKIIRLLNKRRNDQLTWGWWENSTSINWISNYAIEALLEAEESGFKTFIDKESLKDLYIWELDYAANIDKRLNQLEILHKLDASIDYISELEKLEKQFNDSLNQQKHSLHSYLRVQRLKQEVDLEVNLDTLNQYQKETIFGNIFYEGGHQFNLLNNNIQTTLLAYQMIKHHDKDDQRLPKIINYLLENRKNGFWTNTYESSKIVETILDGLLEDKEEYHSAKLRISGGIKEEIESFPYATTISPNESIQIQKEGDEPVYFTFYQRYWNNAPEARNNDFEIVTYVKEARNNQLIAGKDIKLIAYVTVHKDAEYVMINVPIPAGCSYSSKNINRSIETHREFFKNETAIYCSKLKAGEYRFEIDLTARFTGSFNLNPAKVELMYFPTFYANDKMKKVIINDENRPNL
ncbi:carboxypeptidase-like regulatory domain-containing protein [Sediminitomix flava]|uniref:TonB-dependent SusC/RagA subfamily outer membrane receptor n=1 Tax=Sediminitomix flava TaxID=379075 RepID=A0A315Z7Y6_SEDFL|nr:alpha-2-macroglobulin family protein [Sediminitomix flava]PWJ40161.1 TonB-dependent SusC/RagA subfamily outer membrane receptor [Sediminitomix flava]